MSTPLDRDEFARWREHVDTTAVAAEASASAGAWSWACFLSEQRVQLAVKGLLHACGSEARGHDLVELCGRLEGVLGDSWPQAVHESAVRLSRHYIPARYPDAHAAGSPGGHYTESDATDAGRDADSIVDAVDDCWTMLGGEP